ncbi:DUF3179 domain-containing protein [Natronospirillum operosum]|uniref:DUF3179 domain-containing protein n=1 Tax=Natronospirillum operosum TaxID=2759953 RepID=A0A4Z0W7N4_9GAMM|nr:DUF3179 domain-containing protein [Natronospirillum operosum]TGG94074.1 DUF3179 domain-containing protein [Natronospirillum operosum]
MLPGPVNRYPNTAALLAMSMSTVALADPPAISGLRTGEGNLPVHDQSLVLHHSLEAFADNMMSGGPPPDGIPSIDEPQFLAAAEHSMDPNDRVIGLEYNGVVRAYPHSIMVLHEIVNHEIGGENIAVTYCPLTATAQGFKTGSTTLGVSGRLINSNLVMYDRDTGSLWPQISATAIAGERRGESLEEINLTWTTWGEWYAQHPDTELLSDRTGFARDYRRDPYGRYNPTGGYYSSDRVMFPLMTEDDSLHSKHMVSGARTRDQAVVFDLEVLAEVGLVKTEHFVGVHDADLGNARIYLRDGDQSFTWQEGQVLESASGKAFAADALPLEPVIAIEAFWFAWNAVYPDSERGW